MVIIVVFLYYTEMKNMFWPQNLVNFRKKVHKLAYLPFYFET